MLALALGAGGCTSSQRRAEEQQALERSIRRTSDASVIRDCNRVVKLSPDGRESPEAQAAAIAVPRRGTSWVVFESGGQFTLYSCRAAAADNEPQAGEPTPAPARDMLSPTPTGPTAAGPSGVASAEAAEKPRPGSSRPRVTSNPEAVKGCKYLESFLEFRTIPTFQEGVLRSGGNVGYVVATNRDGDVVGESYSCPADP